MGRLGFFALVFAFSIGLFGCDEIEGILRVKEPLTLKNNKNKNVVIPMGEFKADVGVNQKKKVATLEVKVAKSTLNIPFKYKESLALGESQKTPIKISPEESGQPYALEGELITREYDSKKYQEYEQCWADKWVYKCYPDGKGHQHCGYYKENVHGHQWVQFYIHTVNRHLELDLIKPNTSIAAAEYSGEREDKTKVYVYQEICRPDF